MHSSQRSKFQRHLLALACAFSACAQGMTVSQGHVHDASGQRIDLHGANWFGFETPNYVVHGLWSRNLDDMLDQMHDLGFNALRLPICPATLQGVTPTGIDFSANPNLAGLNSLQVLDTVIARLEQHGMYYLLDHHRPDCNAISELWYTSGYSEQQWITDLQFMARRYGTGAHFIGIDLKNEPHGAATWGSGNAATDWNSAAERAGKAVLAVAPRALIFVEGISANNYCTDSSAGTWWGGNVGPQACKPIDLPASQLVLSPHVYGPDVFPQDYFGASDFPNNLPPIWTADFGKLTALGYDVIVGETGGKYGTGDPRDKAFQDALFPYLVQHGITDSFYWSWNPNSGDTGGILEDDWKTVRQDKMALLKSYWAAAGSPPPTPPTPPSPPAPPTPPSPPAPPSNVKVTTTSDWGSGYCDDVLVTNTGSQPLTWTVAIPVQGQVSQVWNANWHQTGGTLTASGVSFNGTLAPGSSGDWGFCANR